MMIKHVRIPLSWLDSNQLLRVIAEGGDSEDHREAAMHLYNSRTRDLSGDWTGTSPVLFVFQASEAFSERQGSSRSSDPELLSHRGRKRDSTGESPVLFQGRKLGRTGRHPPAGKKKRLRPSPILAEGENTCAKGVRRCLFPPKLPVLSKVEESLSEAERIATQSLLDIWSFWDRKEQEG